MTAASVNAFDVLSNGHTCGQGSSVNADFSSSSSNAAACGSHSGGVSELSQQGAGEEKAGEANGWQPQRKQRKQRRATAPAACVLEPAAGSSNHAAACDVSMYLSACQTEEKYQTLHREPTAVRLAPAVKKASLADNAAVQSPNAAGGRAVLLKAQSLVPQETPGGIGEDAELLAAAGRTLHQRSSSQPPELLHGRVSPTSFTPPFIPCGRSSVLQPKS